MRKSHKAYPPEFKDHLVELVRRGCLRKGGTGQRAGGGRTGYSSLMPGVPTGTALMTSVKEPPQSVIMVT